MIHRLKEGKCHLQLNDIMTLELRDIREVSLQQDMKVTDKRAVLCDTQNCQHVVRESAAGPLERQGESCGYLAGDLRFACTKLQIDDTVSIVVDLYTTG